MTDINPDFVVNIGDLHYSCRNSSTKDHVIFAYHEMFKSPRQRKHYERYPLVYTFDDHDFGSNNADGLSRSGPHVNAAYKVLFKLVYIYYRKLYQVTKFHKINLEYIKTLQLARFSFSYLMPEHLKTQFMRISKIELI